MTTGAGTKHRHTMGWRLDGNGAPPSQALVGRHNVSPVIASITNLRVAWCREKWRVLGNVSTPPLKCIQNVTKQYYVLQKRIIVKELYVHMINI